jgi:GntR family transcriptional regulator, transcriptional repressor for pyruvate dehydrogenase complex
MNDTVFRPERVRRPREQVEHQIRTAILSGDFKAGERLPSEAELAKSFGVSRSTVREALHALKTSGLITTTPGATGGSFVEGVDHHSLAERFGEALDNVVQLGTLSYTEVADVRRLLEIPSARLAAENRRAEHLDQLRDVIEKEKTVAVSDPEVPALNASFHRTLADASGNRMLAALVSALHRVTLPLSYIETSAALGRESVIQHIRIASAVRDGDPGAAETAMTEHLEYLREHVSPAEEIGRVRVDRGPARPAADVEPVRGQPPRKLPVRNP